MSRVLLVLVILLALAAAGDDESGDGGTLTRLNQPKRGGKRGLVFLTISLNVEFIALIGSYSYFSSFVSVS